MRTPRLYIFAVGVVILVTAFILNGTYLAQGNEQNNPTRVELINKTHALEVTKAEVAGSQIHLAIKNRSEKKVNWFRLSFGKFLSVEADLAFSEAGSLASGETHEETYSIDEPDSGALIVTVVAVVFEDKTDEGEERFAHYIRETRAGQKMALTKLIPLLEKPITSSDQELDANLQTVETEIADTSSFNDKLSEAKHIGIRNVQERMLMDLRRIKNLRSKKSKSDIRQDLGSIKTKYEAIETKLD